MAANKEYLAFKPIERTLGRLAYEAMHHHAQDVVGAVSRALRAKDYSTAYEVLPNIDFQHAEIAVRSKAAPYFKAAYLLGASFVHHGLRNLPRDAIDRLPPYALNSITQTHADIVSTRAELLIRKALVKIIRNQQYNFHEGMFAKKDDGDDPLVDVLNAAVDSNAQMMASASANLSTSRLVAYGFLNEADVQGIAQYQLEAVMDERTTVICQDLNGRTFDVQVALNFMDSLMQATDPESLRSLAPFIGDGAVDEDDITDMSDDELQAQGVMIPPFHFGCYAEGTRVFTRRGFIEFRDVDTDIDEFLSLNPGTRQLEWVRAKQKMMYTHKGKMLRVTNDGSSVGMLVTPDHTLLYDRRVDRGKAGRQWELRFGRMEEIESVENKLCVSAELNPTGWALFYGRDAASICGFLGHYVAEGYMHSGHPTIVQHNQAKRTLMEANAKSLGVDDFKSWGDRFQVKLSWLTNVIAQCGSGAAKKRIPEFVFEASPVGRRAFLDGFLLGDGWHWHGDCFGFDANLKIYTTSSPGLRDDLVRLLLSLGKSVSLRTEQPKPVEHGNGTYTAKGPQFYVYELSSKRRAAQLETVAGYRGFVYDVELEKNHTLLIEYDGKIAWGSNCRTILVRVGDVQIDDSTLPDLSDLEDSGDIEDTGISAEDQVTLPGLGLFDVEGAVTPGEAAATGEIGDLEDVVDGEIGDDTSTLGNRLFGPVDLTEVAASTAAAEWPDAPPVIGGDESMLEFADGTVISDGELAVQGDQAIVEDGQFKGWRSASDQTTVQKSHRLSDAAHDVPATPVQLSAIFEKHHDLHMTLLRPVATIRRFHVPYVAGASIDGTHVYVDPCVPLLIKVNGKLLDPSKYLVRHEIVEWWLMTHLGWGYYKAHSYAIAAEYQLMRDDGFDDDDIKSYEAQMQTYVHEDEDEVVANLPSDLYPGPYQGGGESPLDKKVLAKLVQKGGVGSGIKGHVTIHDKAIHGTYSSDDWRSAGVVIDAVGADKALSKLNQIGVSPAEFHSGMMGGHPGKLLIRNSYDGFSVGSDIKDAAGKTIGGFSRNFDLLSGNRIVDHSTFELFGNSQGHGIGKDILAGQVALYQKMGMKQITLSANIDVGGYAWAKYGFVPIGKGPLFGGVGMRAQELYDSGTISKATYDAVDKLSRSEDPKTMWTISDLTQPVGKVTLGKSLLLGRSWLGKLDLNDTDSMKRFHDYVGK